MALQILNAGWYRFPPVIGLLLTGFCFCTISKALDPKAPIVPIPRVTHRGSGQVFYFVVTDRFSRGKCLEDFGHGTGDPNLTGFDPTRIGYFHGGDLAGITKKLQYIKSLGATAIWITPPFVNQVFDGQMTGYHGYWILDFTKIDPHLGNESDFSRFVEAAHALGIKVYLDIVINHTGDIIHYKGSNQNYVPLADQPYRDSDGNRFDPHKVAFNGVNSADRFPQLSASSSFPLIPIVSAKDAHRKSPDWLNDVTLYHNRGNSTFRGESSLYGDFSNLDDLFTENPKVVNGFIEVYGEWIEKYHIDGFRIDTVRHVNMEFWQAFGAGIRTRAKNAGVPDFLMFGEIADETGDVPLISEYTTTGTLDAALDFGFFVGARSFISKLESSSKINAIFDNDDWYTDHDSNVQEVTTFISNHDAGRFGSFLKRDNPLISSNELARRSLLAEELLLSVRGQPVLYYGDEQGMIGNGGYGGAREDMFASVDPDYRYEHLMECDRAGADDKFDSSHPFFRSIAVLSRMRQEHAGLRSGAMILHKGTDPRILAFSRVERREQIEYVVILNQSATEEVSQRIETLAPRGTPFGVLYDSYSKFESGDIAPEPGTSTLQIAIKPLEFMILMARHPIASPAAVPTVVFNGISSGSVFKFESREVGGTRLVIRQPLEATPSSGDLYGEMTFSLERSSRPGQYQVLGTSDRYPFRIFWRPPPDINDSESFSLIATYDDLRGHRSAAIVPNLRLAHDEPEFGIQGSHVPFIEVAPAPFISARLNDSITLHIEVSGTPPFDTRWLHNGEIVTGSNGTDLHIAHLTKADIGSYRAMVHNREASTCTSDTFLTLTP